MMIYILLSIKTRIETNIKLVIDYEHQSLFISYYPLKQGLKPVCPGAGNSGDGIYILLSIKTRIETLLFLIRRSWDGVFISYYPLKQGLKLCSACPTSTLPRIYILLSIKTRIETDKRRA